MPGTRPAASAAASGRGGYLAARALFRACFVAGTPVLTPDGWKKIEELIEGDLVLSRSEFDPSGAVAARRVLQTFVRVSPVLNLHAGGRIIGTTGEHPFWVEQKGWTPARELRIGDVLVSHDGQRILVEGVADSGRVETVYNVEVEEYHTYFVGCQQWGFSLWAHNAECLPTPRQAQHGATDHQGAMNQLAAHYQAGNPHPQMPPGVTPVAAEVRTNQAPLNPAHPDGPPLRGGAVSPSGEYNARPDVQVLGSDGKVYVTEVTRGGPVATTNYAAHREAQLRSEYGAANFGGYDQVVLP